MRAVLAFYVVGVALAGVALYKSSVDLTAGCTVKCERLGVLK